MQKITSLSSLFGIFGIILALASWPSIFGFSLLALNLLISQTAMATSPCPNMHLDRNVYLDRDIYLDNETNETDNTPKTNIPDTNIPNTDTRERDTDERQVTSVFDCSVVDLMSPGARLLFSSSVPSTYTRLSTEQSELNAAENQRRDFIAGSIEQLRADIARGEGETLATYVALNHMTLNYVVTAGRACLADPHCDLYKYLVLLR